MGKEKNKTQGFDGHYVAEKIEGGKYKIKDVPIFAEVKDEESRLETKVTPEDLRKIVSRDKLRVSEGYLSPLHLNHHEDGAEVMKIGFIILKRVGTITYEGEPTKVIFADFLDIEDHIFNLIKDNRFPYRSAEVNGLGSEKPEITSLALMEHDTPFFILPLLTNKKEIDNSQKQVSLNDGTPVRAFQTIDSDHKYSRVLFSLGGIMSTKKTKWELFKSLFAEETEEEKKKREAAEAAKKAKLQENETPEEKKKREDKEKLQENETDEEKKKREEKEKMEADPNGRMDRIESVLAQIVAKLGIEEETKPPEEQEATGPVQLKETFKLKGRLAALEDKDKKRDLSDDKKLMIADGEKRLAKFNITGLKKKLEKVVEKGKPAMDSYIEGLEEQAAIDPNPTFEHFKLGDHADDPLMIAFSQKGPEIYEKAVRASIAFKEQTNSTDREGFIKNHMAANGSSEPVTVEVPKD